MTKKLVFIFSIVVLVAFLFTSCSKTTASTAGCIYTNIDSIAPAAESAYIQAYLTAHGLTATKAPSGIFYTINSAGSGTIPAVCSYVRVKYTGWLLPSSFKFAEDNSGSFNTLLGSTILGWQKGVPLIMPGGNITLYIPPSLAYGANPSGIIPANSYLIFGIELLAVQ